MKKQNIVILVLILVIIFGGLIALKVFKPHVTCWPYCGQTKVDKVKTGDTKDQIKTGLANPASVSENSEHFLHLNIRPGDKISSPLKITGESGGGWFFEGSFPINLVDWDGKIIATGIAKTTADWMTTKFVPFEAELTFTVPANVSGQSTNKGTIIFKKDNPSGLPQNDAAYELPITF